MKRQGQPKPYAALCVKIGEWASEGKSHARIAIELDDNYWTVRKWRRRVQQQGKAGLVSTMGRPATGALSTCKMTPASGSWQLLVKRK